MSLKPSKDTILESLVQYANIALCFFVFGVGIRYFEYKLLSATDILPADQCLTANAWGVLLDVCRFALANVVLLPVFLLISLWKSKVANVLFRCIFAIAIMVSCGMVAYYSVSGVPLDGVVLMYTPTELIDIVGNSTMSPISAIIAMIALPIVFFVLSKRVLISLREIHILFCTILLIGIVASLIIGQPRSLANYQTCENKQYYFLHSVIDVAKNTERAKTQITIKDIVDFQSYFPEYNFVSERTPFLYKNNISDVLSPYFNKAETAPNIVIIICEGLGRAFSGENSVIPSATPFLDSLTQKSLCWENCLSTSQRTFGVLPAILGSLPCGEAGFMSYSKSAPNFHSLFTILKENDYYNSFFYGGWIDFDQMGDFMNCNKTDNYIGFDYLHDSLANSRNTWGLYDHVLFAEATKRLDNRSPRVDVYLTLTTHDPFEYPNADFYEKKYADILAQHNVSNISQNLIHQYASYLYLDESLQGLLQQYKQRKDYENTIFVITGDHYFRSSTNLLETYHVPLIIWSPLLKTNRKFPAVVSHRSITPSVLAMLHSQYGVNLPGEVAWLNSGLDTSATFRCNLFVPMMKYDRSFSSIIYKNLLWDGERAYKIEQLKNRLVTTPCEEQYNIEDFSKKYRDIDLFVMGNNALIQNAFVVQNWKSKEIIKMEKKRKIDLQGDFPLTIMNYTIQSGEEFLQYEMRCDFCIPQLQDSIANQTPVRIVTSITRGREQHYWAAEEINKSNSDTWFSHSDKRVFDFGAYDIQPGDEVSVYLWNPSERPLFIANLQLEAKVYFQESEE